MSSVQTHPELDRDDADDARVRPSLHMTEGEFVDWCGEDTRAEWVDGEVIFMAPESGDHSDLAWWLQTILQLFVRQGDLGVVRGPNFVIRLGNQRRRRVPDVIFMAKSRLQLLNPTHFEGAPDLCVEIVSWDSQSRDRREKYLEFERAGVREYWIIDPLSRTVEGYALGDDQKFHLIPADADERLLSRVLSGFFLRQAWLFGTSALPNVVNTLREMGVEPH
jgi:Uma2 family endonuclease